MISPRSGAPDPQGVDDADEELEEEDEEEHHEVEGTVVPAIVIGNAG